MFGNKKALEMTGLIAIPRKSSLLLQLWLILLVLTLTVVVVVVALLLRPL